MVQGPAVDLVPGRAEGMPRPDSTPKKAPRGIPLALSFRHLFPTVPAIPNALGLVSKLL